MPSPHSASLHWLVQASVFTRAGVTRIVDYAFELARGRRSYVTSATKSNGIVHTMPFWDEVVAELAPQWLADHEVASGAARSWVSYQPLGVVFAVMPMLVFYFLIKNMLISGMVLGAVKG